MMMRVFCIVICIGLFSGCGGSSPKTRYYKLDIPPAPTPVGPSAPASLRIEPFRNATLLRQDEIVYRPSEVEVGFYEYHRWAEPPSDTITKAVADQLTRRHIFQSVEISNRREKADYVLRGRIDQLQEVDYEGALRVQVSISATLEDPVQGQKIWSGSASSEQLVAKSDVQAVVVAMSHATQESIRRLATDIAKFVQVNRLAASSAPGPQR